MPIAAAAQALAYRLSPSCARAFLASLAPTSAMERRSAKAAPSYRSTCAWARSPKTIARTVGSWALDANAASSASALSRLPARSQLKKRLSTSWIVDASDTLMTFLPWAVVTSGQLYIRASVVPRPFLTGCPESFLYACDDVGERRGAAASPFRGPCPRPRTASPGATAAGGQQDSSERIGLHAAPDLLASLHALEDAGLSEDRKVPRDDREVHVAASRHVTHGARATGLGETHKQRDAAGIRERLEEARREHLRKLGAAGERTSARGRMVAWLHHGATVASSTELSSVLREFGLSSMEAQTTRSRRRTYWVSTKAGGSTRWTTR